VEDWITNHLSNATVRTVANLETARKATEIERHNILGLRLSEDLPEIELAPLVERSS